MIAIGSVYRGIATHKEDHGIDSIEEVNFLFTFIARPAIAKTEIFHSHV